MKINVTRLTAGRRVFSSFLRMASTANNISPPLITSKIVQFRTDSGKDVSVEAVYEDSIPGGSVIGTVFSFHGAPGSHNDFKYIRNYLDEAGIRHIGINHPGFGNTACYENQAFTNEERQAFSNALIDKLEVTGKTIMIGHSRGCENALITAADRESEGVILINPIGLRIHKGIRPLIKLQTIDFIYNWLPKSYGDAMMLKIYNWLKFKVGSGEEAHVCLATMIQTYVERQLPYIEKLNELKTKTLHIYAGRDHLVEPEIIDGSLDYYHDIWRYKFKESIDEKGLDKILKTYDMGHKGSAVLVDQDNHWQNKTQASLVADVIKKMLSVPDYKQKESSSSSVSSQI